jgi:hypothetical protein
VAQSGSHFHLENDGESDLEFKSISCNLGKQVWLNRFKTCDRSVASSSNWSDEHYCVWIACEGFFIYTLTDFLAADVEKVRYNDLFVEEEDAIIVSKIDVTNRILLL